MQQLNFSLPFNDELNYSVTIHTFLKTAPKSNNSLSYQINWRLKEKTLGGGSVVAVNRTNIILNNTQFHEVMDEILLNTSKVLNTLTLDIDSSGNIRRIRNLETIRKQWNEIRTKIHSAYTGEIVEPFITPMEKTIAKEAAFIEALSKDPFYRFFLSIYGEYGEYGRTDNNNMDCELQVSDFRIGTQATYKVNEMNRLYFLDSGEYEIIKKITLNPSDKEKIESQFSSLYKTQGTLEVPMQCKYILSSDKRIVSANSKQELFWNEKLQKSVTMQINRS